MGNRETGRTARVRTKKGVTAIELATQSLLHGTGRTLARKAFVALRHRLEVRRLADDSPHVQRLRRLADHQVGMISDTQRVQQLGELLSAIVWGDARSSS